ncbi:MAG: efflux RND transporter permease subunit [Acidobacteria bacterium]|nr:efflux RND transporter permease subunit [Acidobacteriota bacterium]
MSPNRGDHAEPGGPIAYMASNGVASNLLMFGILAVGLVSLTGLEQEAWPTVPFNQFEISVALPGATPEEVEEAIVVKIEDEVRGLADVKTVRSVAAPGMASVRVEFDSGTDMGAKRDEVESAVGRIQTFPGAAERPQIREMTNAQSMMRLVLYGDVPERSLKELAYRIEDDLASLPDVSQVETSGVRNYEISIEVPLQRLRALGLTLTDVASTIRRGSLDLSAGSINTERSEVRVRTLGQSYDQQDFENIVILGREDGTVVRLGDIAEVRDGFEDSGLLVRHEGRPAVFVEVSRADGERVMDVASAVRDYVANELTPALPDGVGINIWSDDSSIFVERGLLLLKNGALGLLLVLLALGLFLEIRLAFWVAVGLGVSAIGALAAMMMFDIPLHEVSLFAFVLAIGIVVDDAIVVSEHIHLERMRGTPGVVAAIRGARRIKVPLIFAVLTTVVAFLPLLFIPAGFGEVWKALPIVVIATLLISLAESLLVLPNHLSHHVHGPDWAPTTRGERFVNRIRSRVDSLLHRFVQGPLDRGIQFATDWPGVTVSAAVALLVVSVSLIPAGIVRSTFATEVEGDFAIATLEMPDGTTAPQTYAVAQELESAGRRAVERLSEGRPADAPPLLSGVTVVVGQRSRIETGGLNPSPTLNPETNIATIEFKLLSAQQRRITSGEVVQAWREEVGVLPQVRAVTFISEIYTLGNPVEAALSHPDPERLTAMANSAVADLGGVGGVFDIRSDHTPGIPEVQVGLLPDARTLGLTLDDLAWQTRAAFFGAEAVRVQRGREEVRVYVRLPEEQRNSITDVERYWLRTPTGADVPVSRVASLSSGTSPPAIRRQDGQRIVTVTADVDASVVSAATANDILENTILAELIDENPELTYTFGGEQQQQLDSLGGLYRGFAIALLMIFALLAIPLRSYTKPFIIMAIIPFGFIGVILGHWALGVALSAESFVGIFGLAGVVVNDSLVMIDFTDQKLREDIPGRTAIIEGAKGRFRPIMLTSLTTFLGFTPLILEDAIQAQFFVPFSASIGCGILFTTVIVMFLVPALSSLHLRLTSTRQELARNAST